MAKTNNKAQRLVDEAIKNDEEKELGEADAMEELADDAEDIGDLRETDDEEGKADVNRNESSADGVIHHHFNPSDDSDSESESDFSSIYDSDTDDEDEKQTLPDTDPPEELPPSGQTAPPAGLHQPVNPDPSGAKLLKELEDKAAIAAYFANNPGSSAPAMQENRFLKQTVAITAEAMTKYIQLEESKKTEKVTIFMHGTRVKANTWRERLFDNMAALAAILPGVHWDEHAKTNLAGQFRSAEYVSLKNSSTHNLRLWFQRKGKSVDRGKEQVTLGTIFELSAECDIYTKLHEVLMLNPALMQRRVLDGEGCMLASLQSAAWQIVTHDAMYKTWIRKPDVVVQTIMHYINQRHHLAIKGSAVMSETDGRSVFRKQGLLRWL